MVFRLTVFGLGFVLLGLAIRLVFLSTYIQDQFVELAKPLQTAVAHHAAENIAEKRSIWLNALDRQARRLPPSLLDEPEGLRRWLEDSEAGGWAFPQGVMVMSAHGGGVIARHPAAAVLPEGARFSAMQAQTGRPFRDAQSGKALLPMMAPVKDSSGRIAALLVGLADLAAPDFALVPPAIAWVGGFLLVSRPDEMIISASDASRQLQPLPPRGVNPSLDRVMREGRGLIMDLDRAGITSAAMAVPGTDWLLIMNMDTSDIQAAIDEVQVTALKTTTPNAIMVFVFVYFGMRHFFRPFSTISQQINRMGKGEVPLQPVPVHRDDEVGRLAVGFNVLLERLEAVTEQMLSEARLRAEEKERMAASLRKWMADTSHELRTPIAVMRAQIEAIQDGVHVADSARLAGLHREIMSISRLVDDQFTLARSDVGSLDFQQEPLTPVSLVAQLVSAFRERFQSAGLSVRMDCEAAEAVLVSGDPMGLRRVFANLLENSLRYVDTGKTIGISACVEDSHLMLHFDDSGPGVPDGALHHLFERFYRVDVSRSRKHGGSGLGLSVCKSLVEAHGGEIHAARSPLGGLRITVRLPILEQGT